MEEAGFSGCSNVAEYILHSIQRKGLSSEIALIDSETKERLSYGELVEKTWKFAGGLIDFQLRQGDVVGICCPNGVSYPWLLLGALHAGATCALLSPTLKERELEHALNVAKPTRIICSGLQLEQLKVLDDCPHIKQIYQFKSQHYGSKSILIDKLLECHQVDQWAGYCLSDINDVALILSSSGSTGLPKGVMITHNNMIWAMAESHNFMKEGGKALGLMPFYHAYGLILMLMGLFKGSQMVTMKKFDVKMLAHVMKKYKFSHLHVVPSLLATLCKSDVINSSCLSSIEHVWTGAGKINPKHQEMMLEKLKPGAKIHHSYGMTETTFVMFMGEYQPDKPESCGKLITSMKCKIISKEGRILPQGEVGELCFKGPLIALGYKGNEQATMETIDSQGWLHSGDLGYCDNDGYYYIVDRIKELIKYQGFQISPTELECTLLLHPGVADAAVLGIPHPIYGEVPKAYVIKKLNNLTEEDVLSYIKEQLSGYKQLRGGVEFIDFIPKTVSGKILRKRLKVQVGCL